MRHQWLFLFLLLPMSGASQTPESLGNFRDWTFFTVQVENQTTCFITTTSKERVPNQTQDAHLVVSRRARDRVRHEVNMISGFTHRPESRVNVTIDGQVFDFFTEKDNAWSPSEAVDDELVLAMRRGVNLMTESRDAQNAVIRDRFSLLGFTAAYEAMDRRCPIR